jgi:hypothetical protein
MFYFLKPTLWKIVLTGILFFVSSALWQLYILTHISDTFPAGFPFNFYVAWGPCPPGQNCSAFNIVFLALDLVIWYLISALIVARFQERA